MRPFNHFTVRTFVARAIEDSLHKNRTDLGSLIGVETNITGNDEEVEN